MTWRDQYRVHPAADVFPMMSDEELQKLGEDVKANGICNTITVDADGLLIDGRNRLEAAERVGFKPRSWELRTHLGEPIAYIISQNIHRRHLTPRQQAELIVAAIKAGKEAKAEVENKPRQVGEVSRGGRGKVNEVKAEAVAVAKEHGISQRTMERALAKADGKAPAPAARSRGVETAVPVVASTAPKDPTSKPAEPSASASILEKARESYATLVAKLPVREHGAEMKRLGAAINQAIERGAG